MSGHQSKEPEEFLVALEEGLSSETVDKLAREAEGEDEERESTQEEDTGENDPASHGASSGQPKKKYKRVKKLKDPNRPKGPVSPFIRFSNDMKAKMKNENKNMSFGDTSREISKLWKGLAGDKKELYQERFNREKEEYELAMQTYQPTLLSRAAKRLSSIPLGVKVGTFLVVPVSFE